MTDYEAWFACDECRGLGDDYYVDENGEMVSACDECMHNPLTWDDD